MDAASPALPTSRHFITQLLDSLSSVRPPSIDQAADANPLNNVPDATRKQLLSLQVLFPNEFVPALDLLDRRLVTRFRVCGEEELAVLRTVGGLRNATRRNSGHEQDIQMQDTEEALQPLQREHGRREDTDTTGTHTHPEMDNESDSLDQDEVSEATHHITATAQHTTTAAQESTITTNDATPTATIYYVRSAQQRPSRYSTSYDTTTSYQVRLQSWNCSCPAFAFSAFPAVHPEPAVPQHNPPLLPQHNPQDDPHNPPAVPSKQSRRDRDAAWTFGGITLGNDMPPVCKHLLACVLVEKVHGLFGGFVEEKSVSVEEAAGWAAGWGD